MSVELATAWVKIVPTTEGITGELAGQLGGPSEKAGRDAGEKSGRGFHDTFTSWGKRAAIGGAAALGGFVVQGVKSFTEFEREMGQVFTLIPGSSAQMRDALTDDIRGVVREFGIAHGEAVPALYSALSAGVPPDNVISFMETASRAAIGGAIDLETAVDGITSVVNAYGADALDAEMASDLMFTAVRLGKTDMDQLSNSLYNVIPTAAAVGVEFGDVTAALATMTAQGTPTSVATTQLRQMLVELTKDGSAVGQVFEEVAGQSFKDFVASGGDTQEALALLHEHAQETGLGINDLFGSVEAGNAALALSGSNAEGFADNIAEMGNAAGSTQGMYEEMAQTAGHQFDILKQNLADAVMGFGEQLVPALSDAAVVAGEHLPGALDGLAGMFNALMPLVTGAIEMFAEYEWLLPTIAGMIGGVLVAAIGTWTAAVIANTIAMLANPATWIFLGIVAAVALLTAGILWLYNNWEQLTDWLSNAWSAAMQWVQDGIAAFAEWWQSTWDAVVGFFTDAWNGAVEFWSGVWLAAQMLIEQAIAGFVAFFTSLWSNLAATAGALWAGLWSGVQSILGTYVGMARSIIDSFVSFFTGLWQAATSLLRGDWDGFWSGISKMADSFTGLIRGTIGRFLDLIGVNINGALAWISSLWRTVWSGITSFFSGIWGGLKSAASSGISDVLGFFRDIPGQIARIFSNAGSWLLGAGGKIISGLIDGLRAGFDRVRDTLSGLTNMLPDWKGPAERDEVLLYEAGGLVIGGFEKGLEDSYAEVQQSLQGFTNRLPDAVQPGPGTAPTIQAPPETSGGVTIRIEVGHMSVDNDQRVKEIAQQLWDRMNRAQRSRGTVNLGGAVL